jgi:hypothetical protein
MRVLKTVFVIVMLVLVNHNVLAEDDQASVSTNFQASKNDTPHKSSEPLIIPSASDTIPRVVMGYCHPVANGQFDPLMPGNTLEPNARAKEFLNNIENHAIDGTTNTSVLMDPKHGALHKVTKEDAGKYYSADSSLDPAVNYYIYIPERGFTGKDNATFLVDFGTVRVKLIYFFRVTGDNGMVSGCDHSCEKVQWEISSTLRSNNAYGAAYEKTATPKIAIVLQNTTVTNGDSKTTYRLGDFVSFDRSSGDAKIHVDSHSYKGTSDWIPRTNIATKFQFTKVNSWSGASSAAYVANDEGGDGDGGTDDGSSYVINSDGSIESTVSDQCGTNTLTGHLYRFKNILWMRDEQNSELSGANTFMILPSGELCSLASPCKKIVNKVLMR